MLVTSAFDIEELQKAQSFQDRIILILEKTGRSKVWLANQISISKQAMNYLLAHAASPKYVSEIAFALGVTEEWLRTGEGPMTLMEQEQGGIRRLPVLDMQSLAGEKNPREVVFDAPDNDNYFAVNLDNPSMEPLFGVGHVLLFREAEQASSGDYILFTLKNSKEKLFRQYFKDGKDDYFKASNPEFSTLKNEIVDILGVLVESRILL